MTTDGSGISASTVRGDSSELMWHLPRVGGVQVLMRCHTGFGDLLYSAAAAVVVKLSKVRVGPGSSTVYPAGMRGD